MSNNWSLGGSAPGGRALSICLRGARGARKLRDMKSFLLLVTGLVALVPFVTSADETSHRAAADEMFQAINMEKVIGQAIDASLKAQTQQNPALVPYEAQMRTFLTKYMSWATMKDQMTKIYTDAFTEQELKQLTAFYKTPLGQKAITKMPVLMAQGMALGQQRVQEHLPELQAALSKSAAANAPSQPASPAKKTP